MPSTLPNDSIRVESVSFVEGHMQLATMSPEDAKKAMNMPQTILKAHSPSVCTAGNIVMLAIAFLPLSLPA